MSWRITGTISADEITVRYVFHARLKRAFLFKPLYKPFHTVFFRIVLYPSTDKGFIMQIKLQYPFRNAAGQLIDTLEIRRLTRGDLKAADRHSKNAAEQEDFLFAKMTGLTMEDLDLLDIVDNKALQESFRTLLGIGGDIQEG